MRNNVKIQAAAQKQTKTGTRRKPGPRLLSVLLALAFVIGLVPITPAYAETLPPQFYIESDVPFASDPDSSDKLHVKVSKAKGNYAFSPSNLFDCTNQAGNRYAFKENNGVIDAEKVAFTITISNFSSLAEKYPFKVTINNSPFAYPTPTNSAKVRDEQTIDWITYLAEYTASYGSLKLAIRMNKIPEQDVVLRLMLDTGEETAHELTVGDCSPNGAGTASKGEALVGDTTRYTVTASANPGWQYDGYTLAYQDGTTKEVPLAEAAPTYRSGKDGNTYTSYADYRVVIDQDASITCNFKKLDLEALEFDRIELYADQSCNGKTGFHFSDCADVMPGSTPDPLVAAGEYVYVDLSTPLDGVPDTSKGANYSFSVYAGTDTSAAPLVTQSNSAVTAIYGLVPRASYRLHLGFALEKAPESEQVTVVLEWLGETRTILVSLASNDDPKVNALREMYEGYLDDPNCNPFRYYLGIVYKQESKKLALMAEGAEKDAAFAAAKARLEGASYGKGATAAVWQFHTKSQSALTTDPILFALPSEVDIPDQPGLASAFAGMEAALEARWPKNWTIYGVTSSFGAFITNVTAGLLSDVGQSNLPPGNGGNDNYALWYHNNTFAQVGVSGYRTNDGDVMTWGNPDQHETWNKAVMNYYYGVGGWSEATLKGCKITDSIETLNAARIPVPDRKTFKDMNGNVEQYVDFTRFGRWHELTNYERAAQLIRAIGSVTPTEECGAAIKAAEDAYNALEKADQDRITDYARQLKEARSAYDALMDTSGAEVTFEQGLTNTITSMQEKIIAPGVSSVKGEWVALTLARYGYTDAAWGGFARYRANLDAKLAGGDRYGSALDPAGSTPTEYARVVLALTAMGYDASAYQANGTAYDLTHHLQTFSSLQSQGINAVTYALIALDSMPYAQTDKGASVRDDCLNYLVSSQAGGGWSYGGGSADPDMTAMVLQALAPYYHNSASPVSVDGAVDAALARLKDLQTDAGGFISNGEYNSESCAQVIVALCTLDIDPETWSTGNGKGNVVTSLLKFYDATDSTDGAGFKHSPSSARDQMATEQAAYALTAYNRFKNQQTSLYDMSDIRASLADQNERTLKEVLQAVREALAGWEADCSDVGSLTAETLRSKIEERLANIQWNGVAHKVTVNEINSPVPGTEDNPQGTDGVVAFTVTLTCGSDSTAAEEDQLFEMAVPADPYQSGDTGVTSVTVAGTPAAIDGTTVTVELPYGANLADLKEDSFEIKAVDGATAGPVSGSGNSWAFTVTAANGEKKEYTITITLADPPYTPGTDTGVASVSCNGMALVRDGKTFTLLLPAEGAAEPGAGTDFNVVLTDAKASHDVQKAPDGTWTLTVTAEDGTKDTYTIVVNTALRDTRAAVRNALDGFSSNNFTNESELISWVNGQLAGITWNGVEHSVTVNTFAPMLPGSAGDPAGRDGEAACTVSLSLSVGSTAAATSVHYAKTTPATPYRSSEAGLRSLTVNGTPGVISGNHVDVLLPVGSDASSLNAADFHAVPRHGGATPAVNGNGASWTVTITAEDGTPQTYDVSINVANSDAEALEAQVEAALSIINTAADENLPVGVVTKGNAAQGKAAIKSWVENLLPASVKSALTPNVDVTSYAAPTVGREGSYTATVTFILNDVPSSQSYDSPPNEALVQEDPTQEDPVQENPIQEDPSQEAPPFDDPSYDTPPFQDESLEPGEQDSQDVTAYSGRFVTALPVYYANAAARETTITGTIPALKGSGEKSINSVSVSYDGEALPPSNGSFTLNLQGNDSVLQSSFAVITNGASGATGSVAQDGGGWKLTVTAEDGTTANYPILVNRNMAVQTPSNPDQQAVAQAVTTVNGITIAPVPMATANSEAAIKTYIENLLKSNLPEGVTVTVNVTVTKPATEGTSSKPNGENGSYTAAITLRKGSAEPRTVTKSGIITAAPNSSGTTQSGNAKVASVKFDGEELTKSGYTFTLQLAEGEAGPTAGSQFTITTEDPNADKTTPIKSSNSNNWTFDVASGTAKITYTIKVTTKSSGSSDADNQSAVDLAAQKVRTLSWNVDMVSANSYSEVQSFIRTKLIGAGLGVGVNYVISQVSVTPAVAGTVNNTAGSGGSYQAAITLTKGGATNGPISVKGNISPTPYQAKPTGTITVYFTLRGDSAHGDSGYTHTLSGGNLTTWIPRQAVTLSAGSTVYDVFTTVLNQHGYGYIGADENYVKTITHPNGTGLSEFTNGKNSGWMYTVNGTHPNQGLKAWTVYNGNEIIWHYTDDYTKEEGRTSSNTSTSAQLTPSVSGSAAAISSSDLSNALSSAISNGSGTILIAPQGGTSGSSLTVNLPTSTMHSAASSNVGVTIQSGSGTVAIPSYALAGIANMANGTQVSITTATRSSQQGVNLLNGRTDVTAAQLANSSVTEVSMASGGRSIANWGGRAITLSLPVSSMNFSAGSRYTVYQISADGSVETHIGYCSRQNGALYVEISATHLSTFVVVPMANTGAATPNALPFRDVNATDWFYNDVAYAYSSGLFYGDSQTAFSPYGKMNRAMLVTVLHRFEGEPAASQNSGFTDVASGQWFTNGVAWASSSSVVNGKGNGKFAPYDNITREEIATILYRYAKIKGLDVTASASLASFSDGARTSDWATRAMQWAYAKGIINGKGGGTLDPSGYATRAEVAAMMRRFIEAY